MKFAIHKAYNMNERQKHIDFESYERVAEQHKREIISAWRTAIGLQDVNELRVSEYLRGTAVKHINGAIIQHWKPSEIEQVIIPKLPMPVQETISAKIQESFALKAESKRLLDEAKMMVEREIEKNKQQTTI